jgi:hypothetical protein
VSHGRAAKVVSDPVDTVEILGPDGVTLRRDGQELAEIRSSPLPAAILTMLAAEPEGVRGLKIRDVLAGRHGQQMTQDNLNFHFSNLKSKFGVRYTITQTPYGSRYALDPDLRVDAFAFMDAVGLCPEKTSAEELDPLLRAWRCDPRRLKPITEKEWWATTALFKARASLIRRVGALPLAQRESLASLAEFGTLFPDDPEIAAVRPAAVVREPRVVVVEDQIIETIIGGLPPSPSCIYIRIGSHKEWQRFVENGGLADVQGVLIDLHLTPGLKDEQGFTIASYLRDHHTATIPAVLMTMAPRPDQQRDYAKYRLLTIVYKGDGVSLNLRALGNAVIEMVGTSDADQRRKLTRIVDCCEYWVEHKHRPPGDRSQEFYREVFNARKQIRGGDLAAARRAVDALWARWNQR